MTEKTKMTPKRAAQVLIYSWLTIGGTSPWWMDNEEMNEKLQDHGYKVTDKRRAEIIRHVESMTEPLRQRCMDSLEKVGISV